MRSLSQICDVCRNWAGSACFNKPLAVQLCTFALLTQMYYNFKTGSTTYLSFYETHSFDIQRFAVKLSEGKRHATEAHIVVVKFV